MNTMLKSPTTSPEEKRALLAERLRKAARRTSSSAVSFAQQRLWFLDQLEPNSPLYNIPTVVRMKGRLEVGLLEKSLNAIVARHEALRARFSWENENPVQIIDEVGNIKLTTVDLSERNDSEREIRG